MTAEENSNLRYNPRAWRASLRDPALGQATETHAHGCARIVVDASAFGHRKPSDAHRAVRFLAILRGQMSQESVEAERRKANALLVSTLYETFNRRDLSDLVALYDERVEIVSFATAIEGVLSYRGHDGVRDWYRNLVETLGMIIATGELLAYRNLVLSIPRIHVRVGGAETTFEQGIVYEVRDGRILRSLGYKDAGTGLVAMGRLLLGQSLETVGLSE